MSVERFIGESKIKNIPLKKFSLVLKNGVITNDKISPKAVSVDKIDDELKELITRPISRIIFATDEDIDELFNE